MTLQDLIPDVQHIAAANRFELSVGASKAVLEYSLQDDVIIFTHTGVPTEIEGRGIGSRLVRAGLEFAREEAFRVVPRCWFVAGYIERHPEYRALLSL